MAVSKAVNGGNEMSRFIRAFTMTGLSSVYLMQIDCTTLDPNHGFSVFSSVWGTVSGLLDSFDIPFLS